MEDNRIFVFQMYRYLRKGGDNRFWKRKVVMMMMMTMMNLEEKEQQEKRYKDTEGHAPWTPLVTRTERTNLNHH